MRNLQVLLARYPDGPVTTDCYQFREADVPEPADRDVVVRHIYLSCDPYMRGRMRPGPNAFKLGEPIPARVVGEVLRSRHPEYQEGDLVWDFLTWAEYSLAPDGKQLRKIDPALGPISNAISVLGMPGLTAWVGMYDIADATAGETVFVSAASGAVGQLAGQLARVRGCRVVGSAGSAEKVDHIVNTLGFDAGINYKTEDLGARLDALCPDGIDVYFDNVGGATLDAVLSRINRGARIPVCGQISRYDDPDAAQPRNLHRLEAQQATLTPFHVANHMDRYDTVIPQIAELLRDGRIRYFEDIVYGIDNAPEAFIQMMRGDNLGKRLVRVGPDPTI